jgi:DNA modification methylase
LIAAEKTGRRGYGIELDPYYSDTIVRRFEDAYGLKAIHVESGLEFVKLSAQRLASGKKRHGQKGKTRYVKNGKKLRAKGRSR